MHQLSPRTLLFVGLPLVSACGGFAVVDGERAQFGACPSGETCSELTPYGLEFVGQSLFDTEQVRLGPVAVGGRFELGLRQPRGVTEVPDFGFEVRPSRVLSAERFTGPFGPQDDDGVPRFSVGAQLALVGREAGEATVRIYEARNGELFDSIEIETVEVDEVEIVNARESRRGHLYAGCEEMLGVRFHGGSALTRRRVLDQNFSMQAAGAPVLAEPRFWDCNVLTVPEDRTELQVTVQTNYSTTDRTFTIRRLEDDNLTACPRLRD